MVVRCGFGNWREFHILCGICRFIFKWKVRKWKKDFGYDFRDGHGFETGIRLPAVAGFCFDRIMNLWKTFYRGDR